MQPYSEQRNSVVGHQQLSTEGKYPANTWQYRSNTEDHVTHVAQTQSKRQTRHVGAYLVCWERQLKKQKPKLSLTFAYDTDPGVLVCTKKPIVVESKVTFFSQYVKKTGKETLTRESCEREKKNQLLIIDK